jgi:hypothetical protein
MLLLFLDYHANPFPLPVKEFTVIFLTRPTLWDIQMIDDLHSLPELSIKCTARKGFTFRICETLRTIAGRGF